MSIVITRALFCDRCANWYDGGDPLALAPDIRREAAKHGWKIRKGEDVCPEHDGETASPAPAPGTDKLVRPYYRVDPNHQHGEACAHWTYVAETRPGKPTRCRFCGEITGEWCPARCTNEAARRGTLPAAPQAPAEPTGRVWNVGDPEPTEDGLTVIDREMTPDVIGRYNDPTWFREGPDRWSGPYAYRLTWAGLLKEHGPVREYRRPAAREDTAPPDNDGYNSDLTAGFLRSRPPCANDLGDIHPSEPGYVINDEPYCRECFDSCGPFDDEKFAPPEGEKP